MDQLWGRLERLGLRVLDITPEHAIHDLDPLPQTNDPFDRLLLAIAAVEGAQLVTRDEKLVDHPLAWRPASA